MTRALTICAWCARERAARGLGPVVTDPGDPRDPPLISHGLCPDCAQRLLDADAREASSQPEPPAATEPSVGR